jgi:hypothetical protein
MFTAQILVANQRMVVDAHPPNNSLSAADGSPTNALWIDSAGSVGIGTTAPAELLDVNGLTKSGRASTGPWPANNAYVFWGTNALVQSAPENYALLQGVSIKTSGDIGQDGDVHATQRSLVSLPTPFGAEPTATGGMDFLRATAMGSLVKME